MTDHEVESVVVLPLPKGYRLKDLLLGEQHSADDDRCAFTLLRCVWPTLHLLRFVADFLS